MKVCENLLPDEQEITEELRKRLVAAHYTGKYYKSICKVFGPQRSPFGQIVHKWRKLKMIAPHSGVIEQHRSERSRRKEPEGLPKFYRNDYFTLPANGKGKKNPRIPAQPSGKRDVREGGERF